MNTIINDNENSPWKSDPDYRNAESSITTLLQTTLDASLNGIISMSAIRGEGENGGNSPIIDFMMNTANKAVAKALFKQPEMLVGQRLLDVFPGNIDSGFFDLYVRVAEGGEPEQSVKYYDDEYGLKAWFEVSAVNQGQDQVVITFNNVTAQKNIEIQNLNKQEQLRIAIQELRRSNENLQEFAYVASHDLQEPLRKIQSFGQILRKKYSTELEAEGEEIVTRMESAAERMSLLINDLLNYAKLSFQFLPLQNESLNKIVNEVLALLDETIREKNAMIEIGDLHAIPVDRFQMVQLFQNLLSNSLKFNRNGIQPRISISSRLEEIDVAKLPGLFASYDSEKQYCVIQISDNGIGFNQNQAENIFGAFQRLHGKSQYPGTGIGLAIVKKVVENHKGYVFAQGVPGEGAIFTIYIPV